MNILFRDNKRIDSFELIILNRLKNYFRFIRKVQKMKISVDLFPMLLTYSKGNLIAEQWKLLKCCFHIFYFIELILLKMDLLINIEIFFIFFCAKIYISLKPARKIF